MSRPGPAGLLPASGEKACPCGSGRRYPACCGLLHDGIRRARTAEELMRSRYSAFALHLAGYLLTSWHPDTRPGQLQLDPQHTWLGLRIHQVTGGGADDDHGTVTFTARSRSRSGVVTAMTERSRFVRVRGEWRYAGEVPGEPGGGPAGAASGDPAGPGGH